MQRALESALAELTLGPEIVATDSSAIDAWLLRNEVEVEDARALKRDFPRLLVYRKLVRRNLRDALESTIPRSIARLGAGFEADFDEFLRICPPVTHYLKDLTPRFLEFALPRWAKDESVPAYIADLAQHEALQIEVATLLSRPKHHVPAELGLDECVEFIDGARLVHYDFAVHRLPEDEASRVEPERERVSLLVYRSPEHEVRYLELGPFAAAALSALHERRLTLRAALIEASAELGLALDDELLTGTARLLSDLAERSVLLGKSPAIPG
ncbi:MAG TPA: putative DNA-binding domain-containing protein [Polyangiaceae bacterium]